MTDPVLLLGGAGLPGWIWDGVRAELPVESVVVRYPTAAGASLREYAEAALAQAPARRFAVVAHSIGGVVASEMAAIAPDRLTALLAVSASIPAPGGSFLRALPFPQRYLADLIMRVAGTRPPANAIRSGLGTGLSEADITRLIDEFAPESQRLYRDRVSERVLPAARGYLTTLNDREFSVAAQRRYRAVLDPGLHREIPTGHLPMLQDPVLLARTIEEFLTMCR
ncbi:alpha/beta fold hydrolase [Nocardia sp. NPDC056100]|uniref:alpha/beta fold hydrolase n=1 Tax=Nocardia sp. NPDC056100 TaxID=3345712 RepID=UPI0035E3A3C0